MKNKLLDLNNHLFAQLEKLTDDTLSAEALDNELKRSKAVSSVAGQIIAGMTLALEAQKAYTVGDIAKVPDALAMDNPPALPGKVNGSHLQ